MIMDGYVHKYKGTISGIDMYMWQESSWISTTVYHIF
jgi:hypothetical protein